MHEAADKCLFEAGILKSPTVRVAVAVWRRAPRLTDCEPDARARGRVRFIVLSERVHATDRFSVQVDERKRMVAVDARNLF